MVTAQLITVSRRLLDLETSGLAAVLTQKCTEVGEDVVLHCNGCPKKQ